MIRKKGSKFELKFSDGRTEEFRTKEAAQKRENQVKQIEYLQTHKIPKKGKK